ncbi:AMP-binding domain-containing protein [Mycena kentingensis (nom. inval.)]|nr:AMP-binding domain-containing protein [Mycena kentingensis (nom. inval.)]
MLSPFSFVTLLASVVSATRRITLKNNCGNSMSLTLSNFPHNGVDYTGPPIGEVTAHNTKDIEVPTGWHGRICHNAADSGCENDCLGGTLFNKPPCSMTEFKFDLVALEGQTDYDISNIHGFSVAQQIIPENGETVTCLDENCPCNESYRPGDTSGTCGGTGPKDQETRLGASAGYTIVDVEAMAAYWFRRLTQEGVPAGSVVGVWFSGWCYNDVLHVYGLSRAGFILQVFGLEFINANPEPSRSSSIPPFSLTCALESALPLPPVNMHPNPDDFALILHSSGSTSGMPKRMPYTFKFLDSLTTKAGTLARPTRKDEGDTFAWMGSICCNGQTRAFLGTLQHGSCTIQPTRPGFSSAELVRMHDECGLNRLHQYPQHLSKHLRSSRTDADVLRVLQSLDDVRYSAMPLDKEDDKWAFENEVTLQTHFASTECGPLMTLAHRRAEDGVTVFRPMGGFTYKFIPFRESGSGSGASRPRERPGLSIEDNIRNVCADLIHECVVVGNGRPSPTLFVEPSSASDSDSDDTNCNLKAEILRRTASFNARLFVHERIETPERVVVVARGVLPRTNTKGNVRRRAVEEMFKSEIDAAYA